MSHLLPCRKRRDILGWQEDSYLCHCKAGLCDQSRGQPKEENASVQTTCILGRVRSC